MAKKQQLRRPRAESVALLGAAPEVEERVENSGIIVGTSLAVLGTIAAIFTIKRCKKSETDFERAI